MNKLVFFLAFVMGLVVLLSNILVAYPVDMKVGTLDLANWLTYGAFSYPLAFLVTDSANRLLGVKAAGVIIVPGFIIGIALSFWFADSRIAFASGTAFLSAQLLDIYIFNRLRQQSWWRAPLISTLIASILDTFLFFFLAFNGTDVPWMGLAFGDLMVKFLMAFILLPLFYAMTQRMALRPV